MEGSGDDYSFEDEELEEMEDFYSGSGSGCEYCMELKWQELHHSRKEYIMPVVALMVRLIEQMERQKSFLV